MSVSGGATAPVSQTFQRNLTKRMLVFFRAANSVENSPKTEVNIKTEEVDISIEEADIKQEAPAFGCALCSVSLPNETSLKRHVRSTHLPSKVKCGLCNRQMARKSLKRHSKEVHGVSPPPAKDPDSSADCSPEETGPEEPGNESIDPCEMLCKVEMNEDATEEEKNVNLSFDGVECKICHQMYSSKLNLKKHMYNVHKMVKVKCDVCDKEVNKKSLHRHLNSVHGTKVELKKKNPVPEEKKIPCLFCDKKCCNMLSLQNHIHSIHEAEQYKCAQCDFQGIRRVLEKHMKKEHEVHQCPRCQKILKSKSTLKEHMLIHTDHRRFICDVCGMRFKRTSNYHGHLKSHQEKKFQCQLCGNFFLRKRYLAMHEQTIHNYYGEGVPPQEKGYQCEVCGVKLKWKNNLLAHMRIHTGEKPYKCKLCREAFTCHGSLRTHVAKHGKCPPAAPPSCTNPLISLSYRYKSLPVSSGASWNRLTNPWQQHSKMDWYSLTREVLSRNKQQHLEEEASREVADGFEETEPELTPLEAAAASCILEMASLQLFIIDVGTCSTSQHCSNVIARRKISDVVERLKDELEETGSFRVLVENAKEEVDSRTAAKLLKQSLLQNESQIEELKSKLRGHEQAKIMDMNEKQEVIASLKDKIHEEITKNDVKLRFVDRWEAAKQGQNRMRCEMAEAELERKLQEITNKCNNEIRAHDEICTFLALEEKVLLEELEKWKESYQKEMKRRNEKIKMLEQRTKEQQILHHKLLELYKEQQNEMNAYLKLKEKIKQEEEHNRLINEMATKIQAWWRGTMVRRGLGPFKKKKKPGKEKKK